MEESTPTDLKIGFHVSVAGGLHKAFDRAKDTGCNTFQIFTKSPRSWKAKQLSENEIHVFKEKLKNFKNPVFAHLSYLPNLCSSDKDLIIKSFKSLIDEITRCYLLGIKYLVIHMGSAPHNNSNVKDILNKFTHILDKAFMETEQVVILIETTAGQGNELGYDMKHIYHVIHNTKFPERIGICLDTAHLFASGYPVHTEHGFYDLMADIDNNVGKKYIKLIHLNDSKAEFRSRVDRHWHIGEGKIKDTGFLNILSAVRYIKVPLIMETPWGKDWDKKNMEKVKRLLGLWDT